ncbi:MAG TPA: SUMF1/EgtB/PvdO family nonheme iron enzyme, partial [Polyangiaceae bacterium]|nr:SUMF1/EgtB/PvdO family nonheme iron enzyme [Polyangiaceae bacterium]
EPNAWGLYDCSGNAFEWTNDVHDPNGYGKGPLVDPVNGVLDRSDLTPEKHPAWGKYPSVDGFPGSREARGGSYDIWSFSAKVDRRHYFEGAGQLSGFRIARTIRSAEAK